MEEEKKPRSSYTKGQRVVAIVVAVLLLSIYLITLVAALTTSPATPELFKASLGASVLLPIMFWCYIRFAKLFSDKNEK
ncbi:MAG: hypothetical protein J1F02_05680 [Lachnospiraceae bacterium]|nr:hypothetical protein [Lachnospiraceae bacterium]